MKRLRITKGRGGWIRVHVPEGVLPSLVNPSWISMHSTIQTSQCAPRARERESRPLLRLANASRPRKHLLLSPTDQHPWESWNPLFCFLVPMNHLRPRSHLRLVAEKKSSLPRFSLGEIYCSGNPIGARDLLSSSCADDYAECAKHRSSASILWSYSTRHSQPKIQDSSF